MASAEGGSVPSVVEYEDGCPLSSRLGGLRERRELPSGVRGRASAENGFWHILKATERNRGGTICISAQYSKFWGLVPLSPHDVRPWFLPLCPADMSVLAYSGCITLVHCVTNKFNLIYYLISLNHSRRHTIFHSANFDESLSRTVHYTGSCSVSDTQSEMK